jgi:hypothetical protein
MTKKKTIEDSMSIPNLADTEKEFKEARHILFTLPGTDIEVSLARTEASKSMPDIPGRADYMVYFRHKGTKNNLGYIHIDTERREARCSIEEIKL